MIDEDFIPFPKVSRAEPSTVSHRAPEWIKVGNKIQAVTKKLGIKEKGCSSCNNRARKIDRFCTKAYFTILGLWNGILGRSAKSVAAKQLAKPRKAFHVSDAEMKRRKEAATQRLLARQNLEV